MQKDLLSEYLYYGDKIHKDEVNTDYLPCREVET